ncbi:hypothetical protein PHLCEN_2v1171 [Hermanssonia centrifuga]|uniref:Uncharacterized protein n=1 Tax=Hermanssonia centrifuga TaxID=98765 RepID=A0A2R6S3X7_9APHY|nr:hypothetical protein PHLCEN_2v1171 [Hermanssonia centrifuga]
MTSLSRDAGLAYGSKDAACPGGLGLAQWADSEYMWYAAWAIGYVKQFDSKYIPDGV